MTKRTRGKKEKTSPKLTLIRSVDSEDIADMLVRTKRALTWKEKTPVEIIAWEVQLWEEDGVPTGIFTVDYLAHGKPKAFQNCWDDR